MAKKLLFNTGANKNKGVIARYIATTPGLLPSFNSDFVYKVEERQDVNGRYEVTIKANNAPTSMSFSGKSALYEVMWLDTSNLTSLGSLFYYCTNLVKVNADNWDVTKVTNIQWAFYECYKLTDFTAKNWNLINLKEIQYAFYGIAPTKLDLSSWNYKIVGPMWDAFRNIKSTEIDCTGWDVSQSTTFGDAFSIASNLVKLNLTGWQFKSDTDNYDVGTMFNKSTSLKEIIMHNSNDFSINRLISGALLTRSASNPGRLDVGIYDIRKLNLTGAKNKYWNLSYQAILAKITFNKSIGNVLPTCNIEYEYFDEELEDNKIQRTFYAKYYDELPTNISFANQEALLSIDMLYTTPLTSLDDLCYNCTNLESVEASDWVLTNCTSMTNTFRNCTELKTINTTNWDISNVRNLFHAFDGCKSLPTLDASKWNTSNVTDIGYVFNDCIALTSAPVDKWDTSNLVNMRYAFNNTGLSTLDLSNWEVNLVVNLNNTFSANANLHTLNISNWSLDELITYSNIFTGSMKLTVIQMINNNIRDINNIIDALPDRNETTQAILYVRQDTLDVVNRANAINKNWSVLNTFTVAQYQYNAGTDTLPNFNSGYNYFTATTYSAPRGQGTATRLIVSREDFTSINFNSKTALTKIQYLKITNKITSLANLVNGCTALTSVDSTGWIHRM